MADADAGSPSAAQRAQDPTPTTTSNDDPSIPDKARHQGLFSRLVRGLSRDRATVPGADAGDATARGHPAAGASRGSGGHGMANLGRLRVSDVAIPKAEIVAVPLDIRKDELVEVFRNSGFSRLPVYKGTLDHPVGLVHLKDVALNHGFGNGNGRFSLRKMLRPLLFAPPSMPIGVLLQKMQSQRIHMALVIDEYGGVDGLVTIEDLIEQVLGEIEDEHDVDEDSYWTEEKPGCYLVQARAPLDEFEREIGMSLKVDDDEEVDTLGGLVFLISGRVPSRGEVVRHPAGPEIEVVDADSRRIKRLRVRLPRAAGG